MGSNVTDFWRWGKKYRNFQDRIPIACIFNHEGNYDNDDKLPITELTLQHLKFLAIVSNLSRLTGTACGKISQQYEKNKQFCEKNSVLVVVLFGYTTSYLEPPPHIWNLEKSTVVPKVTLDMKRKKIFRHIYSIICA